jgi:hypothetical protein
LQLCLIFLPWNIEGVKRPRTTANLFLAVSRVQWRKEQWQGRRWGEKGGGWIELSPILYFKFPFYSTTTCEWLFNIILSKNNFESYLKVLFYFFEFKVLFSWNGIMSLWCDLSIRILVIILLCLFFIFWTLCSHLYSLSWPTILQMSPQGKYV